MFLLDTNACISLLNGSSPLLAKRMLSHHPSEIMLCSVVKAELLYGARHSRRVEQNLDLLSRFMAPFHSLPFDDDSAERYAVIRQELAARGQPFGPNDTLIAAIAMRNDLVLVTRNTREFGRITGLRWVNWEAD